MTLHGVVFLFFSFFSKALQLFRHCMSSCNLCSGRCSSCFASRQIFASWQCCNEQPLLVLANQAMRTPQPASLSMEQRCARNMAVLDIWTGGGGGGG